MSWRAEIVLIRLWLEVGQQEQERRFEAPIDDPLRQCKLSPVDIEILAALVRPLRSARPDAQSHHSKHALRYMSALTTSKGLVSTAFRTSWNTFPATMNQATVSN